MIGNFVSVRLSPRLGLDRTIWLGLSLQIAGSVINTIWGVTGLNQQPDWLFGTHLQADKRWPQYYGIVGGPMPRGYLNQFMYPFRKTAEEKAAAADNKPQSVSAAV